MMCNEIVPYSKTIALNTTHRTKNYGLYFSIVPYWWYEWLMQWNWHVQKNHGTFYACWGKNKISIHRVIMNCYDPKTMIDHVNHNGLNNTHCNLRVSTNRLNQANSVKQRNRTSKYKGVSFYKNKGKFTARMRGTKHDYFLGMFVDEVDAAKAYDVKAKEVYGEFANLNFPIV